MRKIITFLSVLLIVAIMPLGFMNVTAQEKNQGIMYEAQQFTEAFNFFRLAKEDGETLTRAEFAKVVADAFNIDAIDDKNVIFTDITESMQYSAEINAVAAFGYMLGECVEENVYKFCPDEPINEVDAMKVFADVLGYQGYAKQIGVYPNNYISIAKSIGLTSGISISPSKILTVAKAKQLIFRAYNSYGAKLAEIIDGEICIEIDRDMKFMEEVLDVTVIEGIVTSSNFMDIYGRTPVIGNKIRIENTDYKTAYTAKASEYIGQYVKAYVQNNSEVENEVVCIYPKLANNNVVTVKSTDVSKYELLSSVTVINEDEKEKKYNISSDASVFVNFEYMGPVRSINLLNQTTKKKITDVFAEVTADIKMVDNDNDGDIDFLWLRKYDNILISGFDFSEFKLKNKYGTSLVMGEAYKNNKVLFTDNNDKAANPNDIKANMVLSYFGIKDTNGEFECAYGRLSEGKAEGAITGIIDGAKNKEYVIGDGRYIVAKEYNDLVKSGNTKVKELKVNLDATFYINVFGAICGINTSTASSNGEYGFAIKYAKTGGVDDELQIQIVSKSGDSKVYNLADSVKINEKTGSEAVAVLEASIVGKSDNAGVIHKLCKYEVKNNEIIKLELATDDDSDKDRLYTAFRLDGNENVDRTRFKSSTFGKLVGIDTTTVMFEVPLESSAVEAAGDEKAVRVITSAECVGDCVLGIGGKKSAGKDIGTMKFYELSTTKFAKAAVRYIPYEGESETGPKTLPDLLSNNLIVSDISQAANEDGERCYKITGYSAGTKVSYYTIPIQNPSTGWGTFDITSYLYLTNAKGEKVYIKDIQKGDVIQVYLNVDGEIANFVTNIRAMKKEDAAWLTSSHGGSIYVNQSLGYLGVNYGEVLEIDGSSYLLKELDGVERTYLLSGVITTVVNRKTGAVSMGSIDDIEVGGDVFIRQYYANLKEIVYFKN